MTSFSFYFCKPFISLKKKKLVFKCRLSDTAINVIIHTTGKFNKMRMKEREREGERERQTDRQTDRTDKTDKIYRQTAKRRTDRQTDRQRNREIKIYLSRRRLWKWLSSCLRLYFREYWNAPRSLQRCCLLGIEHIRLSEMKGRILLLLMYMHTKVLTVYEKWKFRYCNSIESNYHFLKSQLIIKDIWVNMIISL